MINPFTARELEPFRADNGEVEFAMIDRDGDDKTLTLTDALNDEIMIKGGKEMIMDLLQHISWDLPEKIDIGRSPKTEDLPRLQARIARYLRRYVWIKDERAYDLLACWAILSYFRKEYHYIPLIILDGATEAGKSTLIAAMSKICYRAYKAINYSSAAINRIKAKVNATICLDEALDNIAGDRGVELMNFIKSAVEDTGSYARAAPKTRTEYDIIKTYTSVMISVRGEEIPQDVINRGIRIQMMSKPPEVDLGNLRWVDHEDIDDDISPAKIRTALYTLKLRVAYRIQEGDIPDMQAAAKQAMRNLSTRLPDGEWLYGRVYNIDGAPKVTNRQYDIATALLPIADLTLCGEDVMRLILAEETNYREAAINSMEGQVFRTVVDCIVDEAEKDHMIPKNAPLTRGAFRDVVSHLTTREIAARFNENMIAAGDQRITDLKETRKITYTLKTLGLSYRMGAGAGGRQTTLDPDDKNFVQTFMRHLNEYDPNNKWKFKAISG